MMRTTGRSGMRGNPIRPTGQVAYLCVARLAEGCERVESLLEVALPKLLGEGWLRKDGERALRSPVMPAIHCDVEAVVEHCRPRLVEGEGDAGAPVAQVLRFLIEGGGIAYLLWRDIARGLPGVGQLVAMERRAAQGEESLRGGDLPDEGELCAG